MDLIFELRSSALPPDAMLVAFRGTERLSTPYRFEIFATAPAAELDLGSAVGLRARLSVHHGGVPYDVNGLIAAAELLHEADGRALVQISVVPRLWFLGLSRHSRVFTGLTAPEVIRAVLAEAGLSGPDVELRLSAPHPVESHVCQYKESDLDFVSRWMEREGMYYFFEQGDDAEKLVIVDHRSAHVELAETPVRYRPTEGRDTSARACFDALAVRHRVLPSKVKLRDYDYDKPTLDVSGEAPVARSSTLAEVVEHGGRFFTPSEGARLARIRAEELLATQTVIEASGMVFDLRPGYLFRLAEHPRASMNRAYLTTALSHRGNQRATTPEVKRLVGIGDDETYHVEAVAIPSDVQFRAPRDHRWPGVAGAESAVVDGPIESDYAQIDGDGRYRVKLACDEGPLKNGQASTAIRMMQPHTGNPEGFHFPLRKGTEVVLAFLAGDPDRPLIAGEAPNGNNPSPVTSKNHTRNIIHTGSDNHVEIEDEDGAQWIDVRTPTQTSRLHLGQPHDDDSHFITLHTDGDWLFDIGSNQDIHVGGHLMEKVGGAVTETYHTSQTSKVTGPQSTTVSGPVVERYSGGHATTTTGLVMELYEAGQKTTVSGGLRDETYASSQTTLVSGGVEQTYSGGQTLTQTGPSNHVYTGTLSSKATGATTLTYDGAVTQSWGPVVAVHGPTTWTLPGHSVWSTSKLAMTLSNAKYTAASINKFKPTVIDVTGRSETIAATKLSQTGTSVSVTGVKSESIGCQVAVTGAELNLFATQLTTTPDEEVEVGLILMV
jgi:type VI secretion system secreted protein VgrG